jgi:hypothetical protein
MPGSGAGLNRVNGVVLSINNPATAVVPAPTMAYGTIGVNDSGQVLTEAMNFTKWTFTLLGGGTGYSVTIYGTNDPVAYAAWKASFNPALYANRVGGAPVLPASSWFPLYAPADQTGSGAPANPMTASNPSMQFSGTLIAVRAVLTASASAAGSVSVAVEAVP